MGKPADKKVDVLYIYLPKEQAVFTSPTKVAPLHRDLVTGCDVGDTSAGSVCE